MVLSMEGKAAQERRVGIAKRINWLSVDYQHAMGHSIRKSYIGRAVGCMTISTFHETAAPGERHFGQGVLCRYKTYLCKGSAEGTR